MDALSRYLSALDMDLDPDRARAWGNCALLYALPRIDDLTSSREKDDVRRQVACMLRKEGVSGEVHVFGSSTTGLGSKNGDVDLGVAVSGDGDEVLDRLCRRWRRTLPFGQSTLQYIGRARVPTLTHTPLDRTRPRDAEDARTLVWYGSGMDTDLMRNVCRSRGIECDSFERVPGGVACVFPSETEAVAARLILERALESAPQWSDRHSLPQVFERKWDLSTQLRGVRNSLLLASYVKQSDSVRVAAFALKGWAKRTGVLDSRKGLLSSYSLLVMFLCYCLRKGEVDFTHPDDIPSLSRRRCTFSEKLRADPHRVGDLIHGFIFFYAHEFDWSTDAASLRSRSGTQTKASVPGWPHSKWEEEMLEGRRAEHFALAVMDPYECVDGVPLNLGRHIDSDKVVDIQAVLTSSARLLRQHNRPHAGFFAASQCSSCGLPLPADAPAWHAGLTGHAGQLYCTRGCLSERSRLDVRSASLAAIVRAGQPTTDRELIAP